MNITDFSNSIAPWVLSAFLLAFLVLFALTVRALREVRHAPYFFQRRQAQQRMQSYSLTSLVMLMLTVGVAAYAWRPPNHTAPRLTILTHAKPVANDLVLVARTSVAGTSAKVSAAEATPVSTAASPAELPSEYNQLTPESPLSPNTDIASLAFSTAITDQYEPVGSRRVFGEGYFTLYATFGYDHMADGMVWSWVWRHNGAVVGGGHQPWIYGDSGPGYVYFNPETGFQEGEYSLEIWVNGKMLSQDAIEVAAGVANN